MDIRANDQGIFCNLRAETEDERELLRAIIAVIKFGGEIQVEPTPRDHEGVRLRFDGHFVEKD